MRLVLSPLHRQQQRLQVAVEHLVPVVAAEAHLLQVAQVAVAGAAAAEQRLE